MLLTPRGETILAALASLDRSGFDPDIGYPPRLATDAAGGDTMATGGHAMATEAGAKTALVVKLGKELLVRKLTPELTDAHRGEVVVVDVDTGAMAFGKTTIECRRRMGVPPGARLYGSRVGDKALFRLGYAGPPK